MTALLRFDAVALRRAGRLLFEDLNLGLGPGEGPPFIHANKFRFGEPAPTSARMPVVALLRTACDAVAGLAVGFAAR